jgi:hypothetical protein
MFIYNSPSSPISILGDAKIKQQMKTNVKINKIVVDRNTKVHEEWCCKSKKVNETFHSAHTTRHSHLLTMFSFLLFSIINIKYNNKKQQFSIKKNTNLSRKSIIFSPFFAAAQHTRRRRQELFRLYAHIMHIFYAPARDFSPRTHIHNVNTQQRSRPTEGKNKKIIEEKK